MPKYKVLPENREVMDVLCCVISGHNKVKDIVKVLKHPQSTVSEKIRFLVKSNVIKKDKWFFKIKWNSIVKLFQREIKKCFEEPLETIKSFVEIGMDNEKTVEQIRDMTEDIPNIFNEKRVTKIFKCYAEFLHRSWLEKMSISELASTYLGVIKNIDMTKFKKYDLSFNTLPIRKLFKKLDFGDMTECLFIEVEQELKK